MKTAWISCLLALLLTLPLRVEQMKELGPWQVHYSAFNSSFLTPEVAKAYGLSAAATTASSTSRCRTSRGRPGGGDQRRGQEPHRHHPQPELPGGQGGDAIYYLAVLPYRNEDTYQFTLKIMGRAAADADFPADLLRRLISVPVMPRKAPNAGSGLFS